MTSSPEDALARSATVSKWGRLDHSSQAHRAASWILKTASQLHLFASKRFHVLLNSLFKVLCNFPSRYLFAIGLVVIFSLTWGLPRIRAALSSNPTLRQTWTDKDHFLQRPCTRYGLRPRSRGLKEAMQCQKMQSWPFSSTQSIDCKNQGGLIPFHSPLLGKSLLLSFPSLSYMLKFSE